MRIPIYQIDAFTSAVFSGNPAAVCPLDRWLDDATLQAIAAENNLSETAFFVPRGEEFDLRWFTPVQEMDLCGHATLASAYVIFQSVRPESRSVTFQSKSGPLIVTAEGELLSMDLPAWPPRARTAPPGLVEALGQAPSETWSSRDLMAVFDSEDQVKKLRPRMEPLMGLDALGVIATAPGKSVDFVCRFFAPRAGVPEDPVTGSAFCTLIPYWSERLGKERLHGRQISARGGEVWGQARGERVTVAGRAARYLEGTILL